MATSLYIFGVLGLAVLVALALVGGIILLDQRRKARERAREGPLPGASDEDAEQSDDADAEGDEDEQIASAGPDRSNLVVGLVVVGIVVVVLFSLRSDLQRLGTLLARPGALARLPAAVAPLAIAIVIAIAVIAGIAVFGYWSTTRRGAAFAAAAAALGLTYEVSPDADRGFAAWAAGLVGIRRSAADDDAPVTPKDTALPALPLLRTGWNARVVHALKGSWQGHAVSVLDYHFTTGAGRGEQQHGWICALFRAIGKGPALSIISRASLSFSEQLVDQPGVKTGSPAFDAAYRIDCANADYARSLIDDRMRSLFVDQAITCRVEIGSGWLMCAVSETGDLLGGPDVLAGRISSLVRTLGAISDHVPEKLGLGTAPSTTRVTQTADDDNDGEPWRFPQIDTSASPGTVIRAVDRAASRLWQECAIDHDREVFAQRQEIESDLSDCHRAAGYLSDALLDIGRAEPPYADTAAALRAAVEGIGTYIGVLSVLAADMPDAVAIPKLDAAQRDIDRAYERFERSAAAAYPGYRPAFPADAFGTSSPKQ